MLQLSFGYPRSAFCLFSLLLVVLARDDFVILLAEINFSWIEVGGLGRYITRKI